MAEINQCLENAKKIDPKARLCAIWVCEQDTTRHEVVAFCHCQPPFPPPPPGYPCPYGANTPVPVFDGPKSTCFCCCSCFAYGTKIATSMESAQQIELFVVGNEVLSAGVDLQWSSDVVEFSNGVLPSEKHGKTVITLYYGQADNVQTMVVTPDHVVLLSDKKIKRAEKLVPGVDQLIAPDGTAVPLIAMEVGGWFKGLHHIGTTNEPAKNLDGHLLISNGIVTADWAVQISDLADGGFKKHFADDDSPVFATAEYEAANKKTCKSRFQAIAGNASIDHLRPAGFRPYGLDALEVPEDAAHFVTHQQAKDIYDHAQQAPVTSGIGRDAVFYLFRLFNAFYPSIHFDLKWDELMPNAHSFIRYGLRIVVLNGGLVRTEGVSFNGLALVLAHEVGHLVAGPPLGPEGQYSCQGQADYAATSAVLRGIFWAGEYPSRVIAGVDEAEALFNFISAKHRAGLPGNTCNHISIDCRLDAMRAGMRFAPLPGCAGGPEAPFLEVKDLVVTLDGETADVQITFNLPVNPGTVKANYATFDPAAEVLTASVDPKRDTVVHITANLEHTKRYTLTVENLLSTNNKELRNGKAVLPLELPPNG